MKLLTYLINVNKADVIIGVGKGKILDMAKILTHYNTLLIVTIPISDTTCAI